LNNPANPRVGLFAELRRRRVLRTLALYIVAAWVLMQVADVVFPALSIPEEAIRYLLFAAVLGFPVALVFAWLFNITPEGIRRTGRSDGGDTEATASLQGKDYVILGALAVVLGLIAYGAVDRVADAPTEVAQEETQSDARRARGDGPPMVAVLPFSFRGVGDDAAFFAGGVHDDLLTQLSQLSGLRVISRTSVLKYQDTTEAIPVIGRALGADAILEGGVQLAGEQIRINAQLIDARTDEHLWAETYDRALTTENIFAVQGEIARAIADALQTTLTAAEAEGLDLIPTSNMAAYRAFHEGMEYSNKGGRRQPVISALERAISLDPRFTRAMSELVGVLTLVNMNNEDETEIAQAESLIQRIAAIAPNSVDHLQAQAFYAYYIVRDYDLADQLLSAALKRSPSNLRLLEIQAFVARRAADLERVMELNQQIVRLQPSNTVWRNVIFQRLMVVRRYDEARREATTVEDPGPVTRLSLEILALSAHKDLRRYRDAVQEIVNDTPEEQSHAFFTLAQALLKAHLALRDYAGAEALVSLTPELPEISDEPAPFIPPRLFMALLLHNATGNSPASADTLEQTRKFMRLEATLDGPSFERLHPFDKLPLVIAMGDDSRTLAELEDLWARFKADYAEYLGFQNMYCEGLAMAGAAAEAADCLRRAVTEPGRAMPFFDPLLPHYDRVRAAPAFQALMDELLAKGWITPENLERLP
jgi:TolB-like protein/predicted GNAT superfamily acetyltransferase